MGVVNVTPDSFSDGGLWDTVDGAVARGRELAAQGADLVDVGGESTRPGAQRVPLDEEVRRVIPVVEALAADGINVSIDTMRADVAERAVAAGARLINDVSGGRADPRMFAVMAAAGTDVVLMHWRAHSTEMQSRADYADVVAEVTAELAEQVHRAVAVGVASEQIVLDPGIGFAKNADHNWALLAHLESLQALGRRMLVGVSRKRFLGELLAKDSVPREVEGREHATTTLTTVLAQAGVWGVRVHDVRAARDALAVLERVEDFR